MGKPNLNLLAVHIYTDNGLYCFIKTFLENIKRIKRSNFIYFLLDFLFVIHLYAFSSIFLYIKHMIFNKLIYFFNLLVS